MGGVEKGVGPIEYSRELVWCPLFSAARKWGAGRGMYCWEGAAKARGVAGKDAEWGTETKLFETRIRKNSADASSCEGFC